MKNFIARGDVVEITASSDIASGDVVVVGGLIGIAANKIADGETGPINLTGIYELPKVGSQAWAVGDLVYWTGTAASKTAGTNKFLGVATNAVAGGAGDTLGHVRLSGPMPVSWGT